MKRVLILVLSCETAPYGKMVQTSKETWDSVNVDGVDTVYYFGESAKQNTPSEIYLPVKESLSRMGEKTLKALEWALDNKEFDYIARPNSSCYVNKKELIKYIQTLPTENVFAGLEVADNPKWMVGAGQFIYSIDVVKKIVENKDLWNHQLMEDVAISCLANDLGITYMKGNACSINKRESDWLMISYGLEESKEFKEFSELKSKHYFYRVKCDGRRDIDELIMRELFSVLK